MRSLVLLCLFLLTCAGSSLAQQPNVQYREVFYQAGPPASGLTTSDIIAGMALALSAISGVTAIYFARKASRVNVLFDVFTQFRSAKFIKKRKVINEALFYKTPINSTPDLQYEHFRKYSYFLNHIGMLLYRDYVSVDEIFQLAGTSIIATWQFLMPHIEAERQKARGVPTTSSHTRYFLFQFEYLVAKLLEHQKKGIEAVEEMMSESATTIRNYSKAP